MYSKLKINFTYSDGIYDGELGIFDETKFSRKDVVIYLLKEMGYTDVWIANAFIGVSEAYIKKTYTLMRSYRDEIYKLKQRRALKRLIKSIQK